MTAQRYSNGAIVLHWLIALALAGELALGFAMPRDASGFALYQLHKSIGITILALTLLRIGWRLTHARPAPVERGAGGFLAGAVHLLFYLFMLAMPLTGWAMVSTAEIDVPTLLYGIIPWPHLPLSDSLFDAAHESHEILAWGGVALFVLHVAGALRHHLLLRDRLLARMDPRGQGGFAFAMLAAMLMLGGTVLALVSGGAGEVAGSSDVAPVSRIEGPTVTEAAPLEEALEEETPDEEAGEPDEAAAGPPPEWTIRPGGSLRFSVDNSGTTLNGSFSRWNGEIALDPDDTSDARIVIRVELASATLGDATQDEMLGSPAFFDAAANPTATWRSTAVRHLGGNRYEADGTLTLRGAGHPQRIAFTLEGTGNRRQVQGSAGIDRNVFGVGTGPNAAGLAPTVRLDFAFSASS